MTPSANPLFQEFQPLAAIATTAVGLQRLQTLTSIAEIWVPPSIAPEDSGLIYTCPGSLRQQVNQLWQSHRGLIFCLATGAVVRLIAPLLQDKATDPAVVVVDEAGKFVISLCGGHQGGADRLTRLLALQLGMTPVLTGAANRADLPPIDRLGVPFGWQKGDGDWTGVSAAIAASTPIQILQTAGATLWQDHLPAGHPFRFEADSPPQDGGPRVWISHRLAPPSSGPLVQWHPRVLWVGIGCERGTSRPLIEFAVRQIFQAYQLAEAAIAGVATLDRKADEEGLIEFCRDRNLPLCCYPAEALRQVAVPNPSVVVEQTVGTPSVAEAAAMTGNNGQRTLLVPKQILRQPGEAGAVTIAVAMAEREYIGKNGQLWLVGTGPGALEQMTPAAQTAIAQADVVIGYSLYVDLVRPLLRPGQIVESLPITQERQRAERAIDLATWGLTVAVISSGDCGIYGMAGLVLEQLQAQGWDGQTPTVQVFPGITALQAAASRVGAPLMHDFCAISLSDLLTPWEVIEQRLEAAAQADFVVALYNPKSQQRTEGVIRAQNIFLQYRSPQTPVALVRSAYRPDQQIRLTTLNDLADQAIDMLTTVLIGNQSTRLYANHLITPRGYLSNNSM